MRRAPILLVPALVVMACSTSPPPTGARDGGASSAGTVRVLFGGDVMFGRGVAAAHVADPFAGLRVALAGADLAVANLESPLTDRLHRASAGPNALEAPPVSADLLAAAGFDLLSIANNHAGDAGPRTVADTRAALRRVGITAIGAGVGADAAFRSQIVTVRGIRVAFLAVDATGIGPRARPGRSGVAWWDEDLVRAAVLQARRSADLVTVSVHGGTEYVPGADPYLVSIARRLASWGADVVWCHGPHVRQPTRVIDPDRDGRPTVVAVSLGNLLFDQSIPGTRRGSLLEVRAGVGGVAAYRMGIARIETGSTRLVRWRQPVGVAVALQDEWWSAARPPTSEGAQTLRLPGFPGDVLDAVLGDVDGDGHPEAVVAFRRPFRRTEVNALFRHRRWVDAEGRTAHVGLYTPGDLRPEWVAGTLLRPVATIAACDGAVAVAYSTLQGPRIVASGAWTWHGFGFIPLPDLERPGTPGCADVDGDARLEPVVLPFEGSPS